jgi:hypothetical protein
MTRRPCWLAGAVALTGLQITVPVDAQSLVEVARLAQVARSRTTGAVRTYTQEDFPPSDRLASRQRLRRATDERYRTRLAAALKRERHLERRLREARATRTPAGRRTRNVADEQARPDKAHGGGETGGGIPLAIAYGSTPGPLFYLGQPVRRSTSAHRGRYGRRGQGRGRAESDTSSASSHERSRAVPARSAPARRAPARNGYAESSRPMHYVAPGIPAPGIRSRSTPRGH